MQNGKFFDVIVRSLPFALSFYMLFRLFVINLPVVGWGELLAMLGLYYAICLAFYLPARWFFGDSVKASLWSCFAFLLFSTNSLGVYLLTRVFQPPGSFRLWRLALMLLAGVALLLLTVLLRRTSDAAKLARVFAAFVGVLLFLLGMDLVRRLIELGQGQDAAPREAVVEVRKPIDRDVYLLILDAYMGHQQLAKYFDFDNSPFLEQLRQRGFWVAEDSRSNYGATLGAMPTTLNLEYPPDHEVLMKTDLRRSLHDNRVLRLFSQMGHRTEVVVGLAESRGMRWVDREHRPSGVTQFVEHALLQTYLGELEEKLRILTASGAQRILRAFEQVERTAADERRKFVYGHFLIPHPPFYFRPDGRVYDKVVLEWQSSAGDRRYLDQIEFANRRTLALLDRLLAIEPPPIILLQADHGFQLHQVEGTAWEPSRALADQRTGILNAFYFPDGDYSLLYDSITPVNSFRVVFKKYVDPSVELIEDVSRLLYDSGSDTMTVVELAQFGLDRPPVERPISLSN